MRRNLLLIAFTATAAAGGLSAQPNMMRASIRGGGGSEGKCTIEVVVDGAAEVEVRGDRAFLRNLWGQPPEWRRFECNSVMPDRPADFRFKGIDGRGRQDLIRDPRSGGPAVVRIEDRQGGREGYTFDLIWRNDGRYYPESGGGVWPPDRGPGRRFTTEEAVRACREEVREQAARRFGERDVDFRRIDLDDNPGRRDWVVGSLEGRRNLYQFACSVDFDNGRLRSVQIDPLRDGRR